MIYPEHYTEQDKNRRGYFRYSAEATIQGGLRDLTGQI